MQRQGAAAGDACAETGGFQRRHGGVDFDVRVKYRGGIGRRVAQFQGAVNCCPAGAAHDTPGRRVRILQGHTTSATAGEAIIRLPTNEFIREKILKIKALA